MEIAFFTCIYTETETNLHQQSVTDTYYMPLYIENWISEENKTFTIKMFPENSKRFRAKFEKKFVE